MVPDGGHGHARDVCGEMGWPQGVGLHINLSGQWGVMVRGVYVVLSSKRECTTLGGIAHDTMVAVIYDLGYELVNACWEICIRLYLCVCVQVRV